MSLKCPNTFWATVWLCACGYIKLVRQKHKSHTQIDPRFVYKHLTGFTKLLCNWRDCADLPSDKRFTKSEKDRERGLFSYCNSLMSSETFNTQWASSQTYTHSLTCATDRQSPGKHHFYQNMHTATHTHEQLTQLWETQTIRETVELDQNRSEPSELELIKMEFWLVDPVFH